MKITALAVLLLLLFLRLLLQQRKRLLLRRVLLIAGLKIHKLPFTVLCFTNLRGWDRGEINKYSMIQIIVQYENHQELS